MILWELVNKKQINKPHVNLVVTWVKTEKYRNLQKANAYNYLIWFPLDFKILIAIFIIESKKKKKKKRGSEKLFYFV